MPPSQPRKYQDPGRRSCRVHETHRGARIGAPANHQQGGGGAPHKQMRRVDRRRDRKSGRVQAKRRLAQNERRDAGDQLERCEDKDESRVRTAADPFHLHATIPQVYALRKGQIMAWLECFTSSEACR